MQKNTQKNLAQKSMEKNRHHVRVLGAKKFTPQKEEGHKSKKMLKMCINTKMKSKCVKKNKSKKNKMKLKKGGPDFS